MELEKKKKKKKKKKMRCLIVAKDVDAEVRRKVEALRSWLPREGLRETKLPSEAEVVVTLGGDGTVLRAARLFNEKPCPPLLCFNMGTVGFLAEFAAEEVLQRVRQFAAGKLEQRSRGRLRCQVGNSGVFSCLNEAVLDRGSGAMATLQLLVNGKRVADDLRADGLILSSSTGSTAYSLSAGGPLLHPSLPAVVLTALNSQSLSFRPLVLPASADLVLTVRSPHSSLRLTVDGVRVGSVHEVHVRASDFPVPCCVDASEGPASWVDSLASVLHWSRRVASKKRSKL